ncbi:hypothetical protein [Ferroacidibacillus organovorans]|uniref:Uncharacterized protein n=1 Tax=Ferroacidibacillus organovorans TaxID=1765683 RepID=A0A101XSD5_9BACL|nr:hypothetical protein [Ferroacidibacillus organovorans]KUO96643.1 hypothetical protein ATW55_07370 [Ferroacidibacillus organovorans]
MGGFFPSFPFYVPDSPGTPLWWDISFWLFQLIVMSSLLLMLRRWAIRADHDREEAYQESLRSPEKS